MMSMPHYRHSSLSEEVMQSENSTEMRLRKTSRLGKISMSRVNEPSRVRLPDEILIEILAFVGLSYPFREYFNSLTKRSSIPVLESLF